MATMYFQLLHGIHLEKGKKFEAVLTRDAKGGLRYTQRPYLKSDRDLVAAFGADKFRQVSKDEALTHMEESDSPVATAVKEGASELEPDFGREVTEKFSEAVKAGVRVFVKNRKFTVTDADGAALSDVGGLTKSEISDFVSDYLE